MEVQQTKVIISVEELQLIAKAGLRIIPVLNQEVEKRVEEQEREAEIKLLQPPEKRRRITKTAAVRSVGELAPCPFPNCGLLLRAGKTLEGNSKARAPHFRGRHHINYKRWARKHQDLVAQADAGRVFIPERKLHAPINSG